MNGDPDGWPKGPFPALSANLPILLFPCFILCWTFRAQVLNVRHIS